MFNDTLQYQVEL